MLQVLVLGEALVRYIVKPVLGGVWTLLTRNAGLVALSVGLVALLEVAGVPVLGWLYQLTIGPIWAWLTGSVWTAILDTGDGLVTWFEGVIQDALNPA